MNIKSKKNKEEIAKVDSEDFITFDVYFQILLKAGKAMPHHKIPMKDYAEKLSNFTHGPIDEFERIFKDY